MLSDGLAALFEIFTPPFRAALLRIFGLTLGLLILADVGLERLVTHVVVPAQPWLATALSIVTSLGLVVGSIFLAAPLSALVAGFFVDDLAALVEADIDPAAPPGRPLPVLAALGLALRFALLSFGVMIVALLLLLVPGVNAVAFLGANAYLQGRQYFEFAALRHLPAAEAAMLRRRHGVTIFGAGLVIAAFVSVPLLNLVTPLFATAFMVRVYKRLAGSGRLSLL